jgi:Flp pilus assembly protein TadG
MSTAVRRSTRLRQRPERGQALVEFSVAVIPLLLIVMAIFDLGRAIYQMNGTAEAAREIARVTSLHPRTTGTFDLGTSSQAQDVIATQRKLVPALAITPSTEIVCVDVSDTVLADNACRPGDYVRVHVSSTFTPATPVVMLFGSHTFSSVARAQIP